MKVVYNQGFGGFGLSALALEQLEEIKGCEVNEYWDFDCDGKYGRADKDLVAVVEELGAEANGPYARLAIEVIPDGVEFEIDEYDGNERVLPPRMTW
jgi:hypothetical protein